VNTNYRAIEVLGDPTRRRIFELLGEAPQPVADLARQLPVSRPAVSQHLRVLGEAGLVRHRVSGTRHVYALDPEGVGRLRAWVDRFWDRALTEYQSAAERVAAESKETTT
jgi:DNA-binding transcriptional ArsR family regulator